MRVIFDHSEALTEDIKTLWFRPARPVHYTAGQFVGLRLPHKNADERGDRRWFTLSSSPSEPLLAITTRDAHDSASSFKKRLFNLRPGARLNLTEPMGDFVLPKDRSRPLVFVAGGIGIAPMRSIIKWLIDAGEKRDVKLLYGVRHASEAVFLDLFEQYGATHRVMTDHLTANEVIAFAGGGGGKLIYLAGPEPMAAALRAGLRELGVPEEQLVTDYFPGYESI